MDTSSPRQWQILLWLRLVVFILVLLLLVWCLLPMKLVMEILIRIRHLSAVSVSLGYIHCFIKFFWLNNEINNIYLYIYVIGLIKAAYGGFPSFIQEKTIAKYPSDTHSQIRWHRNLTMQHTECTLTIDIYVYMSVVKLSDFCCDVSSVLMFQ